MSITKVLLGICSFGLGAAALGQSLYINSGSSATGVWEADRNFNGGFINTDTSLGTGPWATQRYGLSFSYTIPVPSGRYKLTLGMAAPNTTAVGQRLFTVGVNVAPPETLDLFELAGFKGHFQYTRNITVPDGMITVTFTSIKGNALVNWISVEPIKSHLYTEQVQMFDINPLMQDYEALPYTLKQTPVPNSIMMIGVGGPVMLGMPWIDIIPIFIGNVPGNSRNITFPYRNVIASPAFIQFLYEAEDPAP